MRTLCVFLICACAAAFGQAPSPGPLTVLFDQSGAAVGFGGNAYCSPSGQWQGPKTDGPASMPVACMYTPVSARPSPGKVWGPIPASSFLSTYNSAACGDTILVQAGTSGGQTTLARKNCDDLHWITIKSTGVSDPTFPPEGQRITPCAAGIASMPGRLPYPCPSPKVLTAQFVAPSSGSAVLMPGPDHLNFIGIDFTRTPTPGALIYSLVDMNSTNGAQTDHIIFDRSLFRGIDNNFPATSQAQDTSTTRGIYLGQSNHIAVIDSWFANFYDTSSMSANGNTDAQCVAGGFGGTPMTLWGVYKFVNNHCEASGEGFMLGGSSGPPLTPTGCTPRVNCNLDVPTDLEVRNNYFFKPAQWNGNTTTPAGAGWPVIKNGFEMKKGARALFEGNVIENTWYQAQVGWCFSIAPKNQSSGMGTGTVGKDTTALTDDFTYRYNYCYHTAYGFGLYFTRDGMCQTNCQGLGANNISIHDILIDGLNMGSLSGTSSGDGSSFTTANDPTASGMNQLNNISIDHITLTKSVRYAFGFGASAPGQLHNWKFTNSLWYYGNYGAGANPSSAGCVGTADSGNNFLTLLNGCVSPWIADHNVLFNNRGLASPNWPAGNFFVSGTAIGFANYGTGDSGFNPANFALTPTSPFFKKAPDGSDLGADIPTLLKAIAGVRQ